jgi:hypothetical protein
MLSIYEGSFLYNLWKKPPLEVYISVYVFNITNAVDFMSGKDKKMMLKEVGPYVFREYLEHKNVTFNENGTLSFVPTRVQIPVPERSIGDPMTDIVQVPNIAMLGISSAAAQFSIFAALGISGIVKSMNAQPILNLTVNDFLWGYEDPLIRLASNLVPNIIHFEKLGLLDRMFDDGLDTVSINLPKGVAIQERQRIEEGRNETFKIRDYSIDQWNGSPGLAQWGYVSPNSWNAEKRNTGCNTLRGGYDGTLFPQNISKTEVFKVYRKAFCRTLPIIYSKQGYVDGLEAYWFSLADDAFDSDENDPSSSCYCLKNKCLKKGLGNMTPCYYSEYSK